MIFQLDHTDSFPDPRYGNPDGFYAVGGEVTPERLAACYPMGIFPYFAFRHEPVIWWAPQERFVIHTDEIHVSHSMRNMINKRRYHCTINEAFADVLAGCASTDDRIEEDNAWLGPDLLDTWMLLNENGHAKSVEVWEGDELVGGLYGFVCGRAFIGDSICQNPVKECDVDTVMVTVKGHWFYFDGGVQQFCGTNLCSVGTVEYRLGCCS